MYKTWVLSIAYILFKKMLVQRAGVALWRAGVAGGGSRAGMALWRPGVAGGSTALSVKHKALSLITCYPYEKGNQINHVALLTTELSLWYMPVAPPLGT